MNARGHPTLHLPLLIAGIAAIVLAAAATTALTASSQSAADGFKSAVAPGDSPGVLLPPAAGAPAKAEPDVHGQARCEECGVIESTWELEAHSEKAGADARGGTAAGNQREAENSPTRTYETLVRLQDGSTFVINDVNPANRRPGERVKLIRGAE